jgi:hypothetical protein
VGQQAAISWKSRKRHAKRRVTQEILKESQIRIEIRGEGSLLSDSSQIPIDFLILRSFFREMPEAVISNPMTFTKKTPQQFSLTIEPTTCRGMLTRQKKRSLHALLAENVEYCLSCGRGTIVIGEEDLSR